MANNLATLVMVVTSLSLGLGHANLYAADQADTSFDQLTKVESKKVDELYLKPGADFSHYNSLLLKEADVAFRKNAYRNDFATRGQMKRGMERAGARLKALFDESFREVIEEKGNYTFTDQTGDDTLMLVPKLINVYFANLDEMSRTNNVKIYAESAGEMTLVLELKDSVTGEILARIVDQQEATDWGQLVRQSSVDNHQQSKRIIKRWANQLNDGLVESAQQGQ
ncbi:DUF3313 family protein [Neiella sp. HB171785]|uniref:DUF3313 family protein n=2 Tax=Neiella litorisoli TaxID=2771431 RepID=A0A8J6QTM1_9GAMM|nr:DUF3313 family protein [Neiella litorisoli]